MSEFANACSQHGVELDGIPLESPWQIGKAECRGGLLKAIWKRVVQDCQVEGIDDSRTTSTIVSQVLNDTENIEGFSSSQWVLGAQCSGPRISPAGRRSSEARGAAGRHGPAGPHGHEPAATRVGQVLPHQARQ